MKRLINIIIITLITLSFTTTVYASTSTKTKPFDFWKDDNSKIPEYRYTKNSIHIKTTEYMLDNIKNLKDCKPIAEKVLKEFKEQNGYEFGRTVYNVQLELYFHIQSEKWARIHKDVETHKHTVVSDMGNDEGEFWDFFDTEEAINDLSAGENISAKYDRFIAKYKKNYK